MTYSLALIWQFHQRPGLPHTACTKDTELCGNRLNAYCLLQQHSEKKVVAALHWP
jgi:hypothetical protein